MTGPHTPSEPVTAAGWVRAWGFWQLPRAPRVYIALVMAGWGTVLGIAIAHTRLRASDVLIFAGLLACGSFAIEAQRRDVIEPTGGRLVRDMMTVWYLAVAVVLPPVYATVAAVPLLAQYQYRVLNVRAYRRVFTAGAIGLAYCLAAVIFHSSTGHLISHPLSAGPRALAWAGMVAVCGVVGLQVNNFLIIVAIWLSDPGAPLRAQLLTADTAASDLVDLGLGVFWPTSAVGVVDCCLAARKRERLGRLRRRVHRGLAGATLDKTFRARNTRDYGTKRGT